MSDKGEFRDQCGNLIRLELPLKSAYPPTAVWLGYGDVYGNAYNPSHIERKIDKITAHSSGQPPDHPPPPSFPIKLRPPSPPSDSTGGVHRFPTSCHSGPPGSGNSCIPLDPSSKPLMAEASSASYVTYPISTAAAQTRPVLLSNPEKRHVSPSFTRLLCARCHVNSVSVREGDTNFCEECSQNALVLRREKDSPKANRTKCKICHVNRINVTEAQMIYCERCWQEALRMRSVRKGRIMGA